ncbi:hypothetical protein [Tranquillimonas rosea]|uniref:hypothetical protein n=1 Tax=Tranquillimonas rosea TaxID=641238 RepID=UPI003BAD94D0
MSGSPLAPKARKIDLESAVQGGFDILHGAIEELESLQFEADPIYDSTADGLAATSDGQQFKVKSAFQNILYDVYDNDGGTAVFYRSRPSISGLDEKADQTEVDAIQASVDVIDSALELSDVLPGVADIVASSDDSAVASYTFADGSVVDVLNPAWPSREVTVHTPSVIRNMMWSWWVEPRLAQMGNRIYATGVESPATDELGALWVVQSIAGGAWERVSIGTVREVSEGFVDDHDDSAIMLDPSPGAKAPLRIIQRDHSETLSHTRQWVSETSDIRNIGDAAFISTTTDWSYTQGFYEPGDPERIFVLGRRGSNDGGNWYLLVSNDGGEFYREFPLLSFDYGYVKMFPARNGSGLHLVCYVNPSAAVPSTIAHLVLSWTGTLSNIATGTVAADVFDPAYTPVDPIVEGYEVHAPASGNELRLMDAVEVSLNRVHVLYAEWPDGDTDSGYYSLAVLNTSSPGVTDYADIALHGNGIEAGGASDYISGGCIIGDLALCLAHWDETTDVGTISTYRYGGGTWTEAEIETAQGRKLFRPICVQKVSWDGSEIVHDLGTTLLYLRGKGANGGYTDFYVHATDAVAIDTEDF